MEKLKEILNISSCHQQEDFSKKFSEIAKALMTSYCIYNGVYKYRPVEIEFYLYVKGLHEDTHVYKRDDKAAGSLFFHYSGMDICFESHFEKGVFGGILIRALERVDNKDNKTYFFGGPLVCLNEVLNTASEKCEIISLESEEQYAPKSPSLQRVGLSQKKAFWDKKYRFIREKSPNPIVMSFPEFDFKSGNKSEKNRPSKYFLYKI